MKLIDKIKAIWTYLDGKKTYIVAILIAVIALLNASGVVLPNWIWLLLSSFGLGALRHGVSKN